MQPASIQPVVDEESVHMRVMSTIGELLNVDMSRLELTTDLAAIDGWDSMVILDLMVRLESEFGFRMAPESLETAVRIGDIVECIQKGAIRERAS